MGTDHKLNDTRALRRDWLVAFICFLTASLVTGVFLTLVARISDPVIDLSQLERLFAVPAFTFAPEPVERRLFISGIVIFPVTLALAWPPVAAMIRQIGNFRQVIIVQWLVGTCVTLIACGLAMYGIAADTYLVKDINGFAIMMSLAASIALALFMRSGRTFPKPVAAATDIAAGTLIILVSAYSLFGLGAIADTPAYNVHFNTLFHAMVQVYNGKELLVDLTSQYGLFPHFIEPFFRLTGLTVLSFTAMMGVLTATAYSLIYRLLRDELHGSPLAVVGIAAVMYFSCVIMRVDLSDPFFQYNPIRLFFPAVTLYLAWRYLKHPNRKLYVAQSIVCSVSILWNFDTGVVSFLSWMLVLLYLEYRRGTIIGGVRHLLCGVACCVAVIALFSVYLKISYGAFPDFSIMLTNQKIFYLYGFMMVPMPLFHPWNLVMLVYMAGLVYAVAGRHLHPESHLPALVFYLSVLGVGLFSYYQGRSVSHCLSLVSYPAFILLSLFAYRLLDRSDGRAGSAATVAAALMIALCFTALPAFATVGTRFCSDITARLTATFGNIQTPVSDDAGFVARLTQPGEEVLILSNLSGIHYLVSETSCPVNIPSPTELFLMEEYRKIEQYLATNRGGKVFADQNFGLQPYSPDVPPPQNQILWDVIETRYRLVAISPSGKMRLFIPR